MSERKLWAAKVSSWVLFGTVAAAPLPFGSSEPAAVAFWCVVLGIGLVFAPLRGLCPVQFGLLGLAGIVIAAYALVLHEQLSPHPWLATPHPIWSEASETLGVQLEPSVSIARNLPYFELGRPLVVMLALICGFLVGADREDARRLLKVIAWSGAGYAAYGIGAHLFDRTQLLWREKEAYVEWVTGTFINRNTAATYFGSCSLVWLMLLCERVGLRLPRGEIQWRKVPSRLFSNTPREILVGASMLFVTLSAMFMTGSRAGVVTSLFAMIVTFTLYFGRDLPRRAGVFTAAVGAGTVALVLLQFMGAGVSGRFDLQGTADEGRLKTYLSILRLIIDHPWFGTGQGTFASAFPAYRSPDISIWGIWDIAHNTLLEIASDMGVPIALLVVTGWVVVFAVLMHGIRVRRRDLIVPVAAFGVGMLGVLHSLVDFSLQIPGYSLVALALVGTGLAQSTRAMIKRTDTKRSIVRVAEIPATSESRAAAAADAN
jgi:O-antigen ligase